MFCYKCGAQIDDEAIICPHCGCSTKNFDQVDTAPQPQPQVQVNVAYDAATHLISPKSRTVALLLAIFLGVLGVHRFYLGKVGTGFLWLFTCGVSGIGWIVDIITIACGSARDCYGAAVVNW